MLPDPQKSHLSPHFFFLICLLIIVHEHDIIHRDIKPDNLLRSGDGTVKIVDFGVSEMFNKKGDDLTKKSAGSPAFMAPELCRHDHGEVSGRATDVWSMGITLYCIRYGTLPYVSESILEMHRVIREEDYQIPNEETEDPLFVALIHKLLEKDPAKRITIEQLRVSYFLFLTIPLSNLLAVREMLFASCNTDRLIVSDIDGPLGDQQRQGAIDF